MNVDYKKFSLFNYEQNIIKNDKFKLGDVVFKKDTKEIGVVIQVYGDNECRTDMFGNCDYSEIKLATTKQIEKYRNELI